MREVNMLHVFGAIRFFFLWTAFDHLPTGLRNIFVSILSSSLYISDINPL